MSDDILKSINQKLDSILKILALQYIENKPKTEQANILLNLGMTSIEVGKILGKSDVTIRRQKQQARNKKSKN
ncbi:MAG: hypothetical protein IIA82_08490 [Thaumarchaeota archaeon]|nr:hypothetical protein [Nitrososphaerota archaeon]